VTARWLQVHDRGIAARGELEQCHCGGWFNPAMYAECARCRAAYATALSTVRQVFPHARIIGTPGLDLVIDA
jgi:hypothetical protein